MKHVCQKRKRDVEKAWGEAAGEGKGQDEGGREGGETFLFFQHKRLLWRIRGEINQLFLIIYIYLKRTKRESCTEAGVILC